MESESLSEGLFAYAAWLMLGCLLATFTCALVAMAKHRFFFFHRGRQLRFQEDVRRMIFSVASETGDASRMRVHAMQTQHPIDAVWGVVHFFEALPQSKRHDIVGRFPDLFVEQGIRACFASPRVENRIIAIEAIGLGRIRALESIILVGLQDDELTPFAAVALCRIQVPGAFHRVVALYDAGRISASQALAALACVGHDDRVKGFATLVNHPLLAYFGSSGVSPT